MPDTAPVVAAAEKTARMRAWVDSLRDRIVAEFHALEDEAPASLYGDKPPGRMEITPWVREAGGGGVMGFMRGGRFFEKAGVHISEVHGVFSPEMAATMPGADKDPRFVATGISLIAHMWNPKVPAVHMNTRFLATSTGWFGGGADLTPLLEYQRSQDYPDAIAFHAELKKACDAYRPGAHEEYKKECDEYFYLAHRKEPRGIGGIFYDRLDSGDWEKDFAFTKSVGEAFLAAYPPIARKHMNESWTEAERDEQLVRRGRYVEFNLLWDRGTMFGLKTGGNIQTILSSMPPLVKWP